MSLFYNFMKIALDQKLIKRLKSKFKNNFFVVKRLEKLLLKYQTTIQMHINKELYAQATLASAKILDMQLYISNHFALDPSKIRIGYYIENKDWLSHNMNGYKALLSNGNSFTIKRPCDITIYRFDYNIIPVQERDLVAKLMDIYYNQDITGTGCVDITNYSNILSHFTETEFWQQKKLYFKCNDLYLSDLHKIQKMLESNAKQLSNMYNEFDKIKEGKTKKK